MAVQITIRNVPDEVRDELAARAARSGRSMEAFLREALERIAARPSPDQWVAQVRKRKQLAPRDLSTETILEHRDADRR